MIGGACYSIYLTHLQVMQMASNLLSHALPAALTSNPIVYFFVSFFTIFPVTIAVGLVFYVVVERTFMIKDWPTKLLTTIKSRWPGRTPTPNDA